MSLPGNCFYLRNFGIQSKDHQLLILFDGDEVYYEIVSQTITEHTFSRLFQDKTGRYEWGFYLRDKNDNSYARVESLLSLLKTCVYIKDRLDQTYALGYHFQQPEAPDIPGLRDLVYDAKPYKRPPHNSHYQNARILAEKMVAFIQQHPLYAHADMVVPVPASPGKTFDLPTELVKYIVSRSDIQDGTQMVRKNRRTDTKDTTSPDQKMAKLQGAFTVGKPEHFANRTVLIIDDIYDSGATMNVFAQSIRDVGVRSVLGLTATKTTKKVGV